MANHQLPTISIVTPSYNQGAFIRETIESVLQQSYPKLEYWVIDGNSTDDTLSILRDYEHDPRFHWLSEPDRGQSDAINKGIARASGDLFIWLGSDDVFLPGTLEAVANAWGQLQAPAIIYGLARHIDAVGNDLGACPHQSSHMSLDGMLRFQKIPIQPATFVPLEMVKALGGVNEQLHFTMDFDLWVKLAEQLPFQHIPQEFALYRLHSSSKTRALASRFVDDYAVVLRRAAQRRLISVRTSEAYILLFEARSSLTPEHWQPARAGITLFRAAAYDLSVIPEAALVLTKGVFRQVVGDSLWSKVRQIRSRF